jgi:membrane-bound lytic murein transglycosylase D
VKKLALGFLILAFTTNSRSLPAASAIPQIMNPPILRHLHISLQTPHSRTKMREMLTRMNAYRPMIEAKLAEAGLPRELVMIPAIESMYRADAVSPREAAGLWQLRAETAREFGLQVDDEIDERLDAEKATVAAIAFLKSIHRRTNDWPLTLLSYNLGEARVRKLVQRTGVRDVFQLVLKGHLKNEEPSNYVPRAMATLIVIDHPELVSN